MSPAFAPARTFHAPVSAGCTRLSAGGIAVSVIATIITTGTGTTGSGWVSVRE
jgi:hypothetical protein